MFQKKNIITVQHPESIHHLNGMVGSWTDWNLTEKGIQQSENIAYNLQSEVQGKSFVLYTSPLIRTRETAEIISHTFDTVPEFTDALKERSLGKAIGKSVQWLKDNIEQEEKSMYDKCFSNAESRFDVWQRLKPFYEKVVQSPDENIIIVSHGETLSIFNVMWLGLDVEMLNSIDLYGVSGGVSFLRQTIDGKRIIRKLSDTSYKIANAQKLL